MNHEHIRSDRNFSRKFFQSEVIDSNDQPFPPEQPFQLNEVESGELFWLRHRLPIREI